MDNKLTFFVVNWFRLTDFVISSLFVALIVMTALLFKELTERAEDILEDPNDPLFSSSLDEWKGQYVLVCELLENIKHVFGLITLIHLVHIIIEMTLMSSIIMIRVKVGCYYFYENPDHSDEEHIFSNLMAAYSHVFLRLVAISTSCWYIQIEVRNVQYTYSRLYDFRASISGERIDVFVPLSVPFGFSASA